MTESLRDRAQRLIEVYGGEHPDTVLAIAEVTARAIADGGFLRPHWIERPPYLPTDDGDLYDLTQSTKATDKFQRAEIAVWKYENSVVEADAVARLDVLVWTFYSLDAVRDQVPDTERVHKLQNVMVEHAAKRFYGAVVTRAPRDRNGIERWARGIITPHNPVPRWLAAERRPGVFNGAQRGGDPSAVGSLI